jgi:hypothetical protein
MIKIIETRAYFTRTASGKSWKKRPFRVETEEITPRYYQNVIDSIPWFNRGFYGEYCRGYREYTPAGYRITKVVTVGPYRTDKHVRTYNFIDTNESEV